MMSRAAVLVLALVAAVPGGSLHAQTTTGTAPAVQAGRGGPPPAPVVIGPSAPVPPEVAIPRPTAAEVTLVNSALQRFVDGEKPETQALLKKFQPLFLLREQRLNVAATFTQTVQRRGPRHEGFVQRAQQGEIDLLLHGDSITDWWVQGPENQAMFDKYFAGIKTANFAIAGDTTQGVLWGLKNGEGQGFQPKAVMLMIGTNNAGGYSAMEIAEGIGAIVLELRRNFPEAKILLLGIFPRGVPGDPVRDRIAEVNRIVAKLDDQKHVFFMDIGARFLDDRGFFLPGTFRPDLLHPIAGGYDIWGAAVKDKLAELMR
jgi:lysophospholipase L1-like esterase